ncbi:MAG: plasmid pRiA4b ORF-3 family protein [Bacteroidales bacterium]|nr:plasmid pRiA4b ORF-3 family protein [Bacteroidales bacterium]
MTYQFKIQIDNITKPPVWRKVILPATLTFWDFHIAIQVVFGWENEHLFQFSPKGYGSSPRIELTPEDGQDDFLGFLDPGDALDAEDITLAEIFTKEGQKFTYIYDFGDDWKHSITLEKITDNTILYPNCIDGKGNCPPEDCGGPWGYENLKYILSDPNNTEYEGLAEWLGLEDNETWDPEEFFLEETNEYLISVFTKNK